MTRAEIDLPATGPTPVELLLSGADAAMVRTCVDALEGGQKQAIALAFFQGLSHASSRRSFGSRSEPSNRGSAAASSASSPASSAPG